MFNDPQTLTISGTTKTFPRQGSASPDTRGRFQTAEGDFIFETKQFKTGTRFRREIRLTQVKVAADPISTANKEVSASIILVIDEPRWGFSDSELAALSTAVTGWFTASNRDQLLAGEL